MNVGWFRILIWIFYLSRKQPTDESLMTVTGYRKILKGTFLSNVLNYQFLLFLPSKMLHNSMYLSIMLNCILLCCQVLMKSSWNSDTLMEIIVLSRRTLPLSLSVSILSTDMGEKNAGFVLFPLRRLFSFCCHCWPEFITSSVSHSCLSSSSSHWPASSHLLLLSCESDVFSFAPLKSHLTIPRPVKPNPH